MFADPLAYERFMGRWSRLMAPRLVEFAALPEAGNFLDIGCGLGALSLALAEQAAQRRITGIDQSAEYVAYAASLNPFPDRVQFETGDAQQLRYAEGSFQAALSLLVFNFIPDPAKALAELRRVIRPGGVIAAAVWDYGEGMQMLRAFWDAAARIDDSGARADEKNMRLCRQGELAELLHAGGLRHVEESALVVQTSFSSFADYWEPFLLGQGPAGMFVKNLSPSRVAALRNELRSRLAPSDGGASLHLTARAWAARGIV
jgi:SAM-dependent methyltransferase